jgi:hypothetical protein
MSLVVRDDADILDAQIAYHLNAGVDFVIATDHDSQDGSADILESYARDGLLRRIPAHGEARDQVWRTQMAGIASSELGADWLVDAETDEFWVPRGETLNDVLVAIPPRYGVVQGLVRVFLPRPDDGRSFAERMTVRRAPYARDDESTGRLDWALRPLYRASPGLVIESERDLTLDGRVPLRAWYPIEVLRFPVRSLEQAELRTQGRSGPHGPRSRVELTLLEARDRADPSERWASVVVGEEELASGLADGSLVVDERVQEALARLEAAAATRGSAGHAFALPSDGSGHLALRVPNVVDDVAYAGECAAVREVDFEPLRERITELEHRIACLEARFWPRVARRLSRLGRRSAP